jgi:hypothetical protein
MRLALLPLTALLLIAAAQPASKVSAPIGTDVMALKPGEWIWDDSIAPAGPMLLVVNLKTQRAYAYRNGVRIGASTISSGKPGKKTPTGVFQILQKNKDHKSNLYNSAPMPYMQRLTWDGIALHAGNLPGYPASHGCVRLPYEFARLLFGVTSTGMTVVVTDEAVEPASVADKAFLAPLNPKGIALDPVERSLTGDEVSRWQPEKSPTGPVTIVVSTNSKRIVVYRNGEEIGRSRIVVPKGFDIGTRAAQYAGRNADGTINWIYLGIPGYEAVKGQNVDRNALDLVKVPPRFMQQMRDVIGEGTTILATDAGILEGSSGEELTVLTSD